jgi:hypothetical protein
MKTMKTARLGSAFAIAVSLAAVLGMPAHAAVRTCTARLTSIAAKDATELGAKKKAITDWLLKATGAGIKGPTWRLAAQRRLICQPVPGASASTAPVFECRAVGHACSVTQNPEKPLQRPATKASGLET